jgi:nicotinamidase-related amidase
MPNTALVLVDFQNDYFEEGDWPLVDMDEAASNGVKLLEAFRAKGLPVVHVRHEFPIDNAPFFRPNSEGAKIYSTLSPQDGEAVVVKFQINSFRDTNLKEILDDLDVDTLTIIGAMSHMCIDGTVRAASDMGYSCSVAHDACATHDQEFNGVTVPAAQVHAAYMAALGFAYANVASTEALLAEI